MTERAAWFAEALAARLADGGRVLDFGCGTGEIARAVESLPGFRVVGSDISPGMLAQARGAGGPPLLVRIGQRGDLPFAAARFDAVISSSVFEYVETPLDRLRQLAGLLREGG